MAKEPAEVFSVHSMLDNSPEPLSSANRSHLFGGIIVISNKAVMAVADGLRFALG